MHDLDTMADFIDRTILQEDMSVLDDEDARRRLEMAVERSGSRLQFLEEKFARRAVNNGLCADEHRRLMHQQM